MPAVHGSSDDPSTRFAPNTQAGYGRGPDPCDRPGPAFGAGTAQGSGESCEPGRRPPLVAIVGATASGKSSLALYLADRLNGEIVNYDSVQVYRRLNIGSGKASDAERRQVPHHLLDLLDPDEICTAGRFRRLAIERLQELRRRGKLPILVGGTGLYLRALLEGLFDGPERSRELRDRLRRIEARRGRAFLHRMLERLDPEAATRIHPNDGQKLIRAIEICRLAGEPVSALHARGREALSGFAVFKIGLAAPRQELCQRIDRRVRWMFSAGFVEEVRSLLARGRGALPGAAMGALGYCEAAQVLTGELSEEAAIRATQSATRRYAKRQMTWFRRERDVEWFVGFGDQAVVQQRAGAWLRQALGATAAGTQR